MAAREDGACACTLAHCSTLPAAQEPHSSGKHPSANPGHAPAVHPRDPHPPPVHWQDLAALADICSVRATKAGEVLMREGEDASFFAIVSGGSLKAAIPRQERWPRAASSSAALLQEWRLMATGAVVGEMSLFSGLRRTALVEALTDGVLVIISFV